MMDYVAGRLASAPGTAKVRRGGGDKIGGEKGWEYTWGTG